MADKMAAAYQLPCCGRSNLVIKIIFLSNFIYGLLKSNSGSSSNMGFVQTKMVNKMAAAYQFHCCGRSSLVILIRFLSNFIYGLLPSNSGPSSNMGFVLRTITKMAEKKFCRLSVCFCGHILSHLLPDCFRISYMDYFYLTVTQAQIWAL